MVNEGRQRTVTLSVPTTFVESRVGRAGKEYFLVRLPQGTRVGGRDLSDALVCTSSAHESSERVGMTEVGFPANVSKVVKVPVGEGPTTRYERVAVDPSELCDATREALGMEKDKAVLRQALALLDSGDRAAAMEAVGTLLEADRGEGSMSPTPLPDSVRKRAGTTVVTDYEAMGVLPAHQAVCSVNTRSPVEVVPERFDFVAFDDGRCVTRDYFNSVLAEARAREPRHGGVLEEHSMGYVARQLRQPFARVGGRVVAEVNGAGIDITDEVCVIPGARPVGTGWPEERRDITDLGVAAITVDKKRLIERLSMNLEEADAVAEWLHRRHEADVAIACDRIGIAHVHAMLRSPDAARILVEAGMRLENPATGERMSRDLDTGVVQCDFVVGTADGLPEADGDLLMDWYCLRVATDDRWRVVTEDALRLVQETSGPMVELREKACSAYRSDTWLTTRDRIEAIPTRERTRELLARGDMPTRSYRLKDECGSGHVPCEEHGHSHGAKVRVA